MAIDRNIGTAALGAAAAATADAIDVNVADAGGYFGASPTVESALQEVGNDIANNLINTKDNYQRIDASGTTNIQNTYFGSSYIDDSVGVTLESDNGEFRLRKYGSTASLSGKAALINASNYGVQVYTGSSTALVAEFQHGGGLNLNNDAPATPAANTLYADSMVKASASVTFTSGDPILGESFNISGVPIDNGVGDTTLEFATNMNSASYPVFGSVSLAGIAFKIDRTSGSMTMKTTNLSVTEWDSPFSISAIGKQ